jgi:hypothetical protein
MLPYGENQGDIAADCNKICEEAHDFPNIFVSLQQDSKRLDYVTQKNRKALKSGQCSLSDLFIHSPIYLF